MGEGSEGIAASTGGGNENNGLGSFEAHDVGFGASEDRRCSKIEVGEAESGAEEGGVGRVRPPIVGTQQDGMS
ncbi:MAG TPA: hypothetical protein VNZ03_00770 [Terriglobales bacterium]|jgi:hypothetical protein|nr:hypothetical protein [Terriglobales bacterium]